jgi:putative transposase
MSEIANIRTGRHRVFVLRAYLVLGTKFRHEAFGDRHLARTEEIMRAVCADFETDLWSGSYFAGSVGGAPLSVLRQYIEQQHRPVLA